MTCLFRLAIMISATEHLLADLPRAICDCVSREALRLFRLWDQSRRSTYDRLTRTSNLSFTVQRTHASIKASELFIGNHENLVPQSGPVKLTTAGGTIAFIANAFVVDIQLVQEIGATTKHSYQIVGGVFDTHPGRPQTLNQVISTGVALGLWPTMTVPTPTTLTEVIDAGTTSRIVAERPRSGHADNPQRSNRRGSGIRTMAIKTFILALCLVATQLYATEFGDIPATTDVSTLWVPPSRTLTIGGSTLSLSADRTWTATTILDSISSTQGVVLYSGASSWSALATGTSGNVLTTHGASANPTWTSIIVTHSVTFVVDGAGGLLTSGTKNPIKIPYGGTLNGWLLIGKPSGSVTVDIFRAADGAGLPVTSIVGAGTKPALSSAVENSSTSFTSWTSTTLTAKDNLAISLSGISTSTYCALTLYYQ